MDTKIVALDQSFRIETEHSSHS